MPGLRAKLPSPYTRPAPVDPDRRLSYTAAAEVSTERALRRELHYFGLYRVLEAALLALLLFSPAGALIEAPRHPELGRIAASVYLIAAWALFFTGRHGRLQRQALAGIVVDVSAAIVAIHALPASGSGIALMLLFNIGAAALLLPLRLGLGAAAAAALALIGEFVWSELADGGATRPVAELLMFAVSFLAVATLTNLLGRQMRASQALADRRGAEVASLTDVSEMILRRLRTGVLLVEGDGRLRLANEAAMLLLGDDHDGQRHLALAAPELARRLQRWRQDGVNDDSPLQLAPDLPEVVPRFARLLAEGEQVLVFLDDTSLVSRRAESLTLATLGRFSASLAHEIRNPLAAISYATQLLEESKEIPASELRLLEIVRQQTQRMNGIVENVLALARRERAQPDHIELVGFARHFIDDYRASHPLEHDSVQLVAQQPTLPALADPRQLHQVLTALLHNALTYGRMPGQPARVSLQLSADHAGTPTIDVLDRGPGIPAAIAEHLVRPFYTTSSHGTGMGLYIARELCRANLATLEHVPVPGGGGCFRVRLAGPHALLPA
jgi:two-component system sensor histidine kinase PilS (NtrC family)